LFLGGGGGAGSGVSGGWQWCGGVGGGGGWGWAGGEFVWCSREFLSSAKTLTGTSPGIEDDLSSITNFVHLEDRDEDLF